MIVCLDSFLHSSELHALVQEIEKTENALVHPVPDKRGVQTLVVSGKEISVENLQKLARVASVHDIAEPYPLSSRTFRPQTSVVSFSDHARFGDIAVGAIAGPCSVEDRNAIIEIAEMVRESGACALRGGAFKPRTSPYSFQGLGELGLEYLCEAGALVGLPVVSEIVSAHYIPLMEKYVDVLQIGARNMQNFELLKQVAPLGKPIMLKRGLAATIEEWLMAAEYLLAHGAQDVVLCERGIRTFERYTRNSLDISAIPVIKKLTHLPVIVDPSHATGLREKVLPCSLAAVAAGADGLIVEVHQNPPKALSDGEQSLFPEQFEKLMRDLEVLTPLVSREIVRVPKKAEAVARGSVADSNKEQGSVVFQGQHGSFSEQAAQILFPDLPKRLAMTDFQSLLRTIDSREAQFGVLPVENSLMGTIHESYDLLIHFPQLHIVGELYMRIEHALIGVAGSSLDSVTTVYSQAPGLEQCRIFLNKHRDWKLVPYRDTAGAAAFIAEQNDIRFAAIAGARVAAMHDLVVLKQGIESNPQNYTRFLVISWKNAPLYGTPTKASLVFSIHDKPGALFRCLETMANFSLNLKKLESRPIHGKPWEYEFYLDVDIENAEDRFAKAFAVLQQESASCRLLGSYVADRLF